MPVNPAPTVYPALVINLKYANADVETVKVVIDVELNMTADPPVTTPDEFVV